MSRHRHHKRAVRREIGQLGQGTTFLGKPLRRRLVSQGVHKYQARVRVGQVTFCAMVHDGPRALVSVSAHTPIPGAARRSLRDTLWISEQISPRDGDAQSVQAALDQATQRLLDRWWAVLKQALNTYIEIARLRENNVLLDRVFSAYIKEHR